MLATNMSLQVLYLDNIGISTSGERQIAASIALNRASGLRALTGFELGLALTALGSPPQLGALSNESVLVYLRECNAAADQCRSRAGGCPPPPTTTAASEPSVKSQSASDSVGRLLLDSMIELTGEMNLSGTGVCGSSQCQTPVAGPQAAKTVQLSEFLRHLRELANAPFSRSELWGLHQLFFSPPQVDASTTPPQPPDVSFEHVEGDSRTRRLSSDQSSNKRPTNRSNVAPIAEYPTLKARLKVLMSSGAASDEEAALKILRQLYYLLFGCTSLVVQGLGSASLEEILLEML